MFKYTLVCHGPNPFDVPGFVMQADLLVPAPGKPVPQLEAALPLVQAFHGLLAQAHPLTLISIIQRHAVGRVPIEQGRFQLVGVDVAEVPQSSHGRTFYAITNTRSGLVACYLPAFAPSDTDQQVP